MKFIDKLNKKLIKEEAVKCKMFWCIPKLTDSNDIEWDIDVYDSDGDDLSNWVIVLHKLKDMWGKDFSSCKENHYCLPRGIMYDNCLYHGNNIPDSIDLSHVASAMGVELGSEITPMYDSNYKIDKEDLSKIEQILGRELGLQYTL